MLAHREIVELFLLTGRDVQDEYLAGHADVERARRAAGLV